ncbi:MAG: hypothetical protein K2G89_07865 [Lachnospiraceae bacterium]|nr:hypothetical protein [Lachnospiraceae bacterium]
MKKHFSHVFALFVTALLLGLGMCMPGLASAFSDKWLLEKPEEVENSVIYLDLSQNKDFMQRVELFKSGQGKEFSWADSVISTEMEEQDVQAAAMEAMEAIGFHMSIRGFPEVTPLLLLETSEDKTSQSCVFWYCVWDTNQLVWIDDVSGTMIGFSLQIDYILETNFAAAYEKHISDKKVAIYDSEGVTYAEERVIDVSLVTDYLLLYCHEHYPVNSVELYSVEKNGNGYMMMMTGETEDRLVHSFMSLHCQDGWLSFNLD